MNFQNIFQKQHEESLEVSTRWIILHAMQCMNFIASINDSCDEYQAAKKIKFLSTMVAEIWISKICSRNNMMNHLQNHLMVIDDQQDESTTSLDDHWQPAFGFTLISVTIAEIWQVESRWSLICLTGIDAHWWSTRWIINTSWWSLTTCIWIHVDITCNCWEIPNSFLPNFQFFQFPNFGCAPCSAGRSGAITAL